MSCLFNDKLFINAFFFFFFLIVTSITYFNYTDETDHFFLNLNVKDNKNLILLLQDICLCICVGYCD